MSGTPQKSNRSLASLNALLSGMELPESGPWAQAARADALTRLNVVGLPARRDEYWLFSRPDTLIQPEPVTAPLFKDADDAAVFSDIDQLQLVFNDGVFDADASDDLALAGVEISRLADVSAGDNHWATGLYGVLETNGQSPVSRPLAILNTAFAPDGILIRVTGKAGRPIGLKYNQVSENSDAMLHHVVQVEAGATLTLLENGGGAARLNTVLEVDVADGAAFNHVRAQGRNHERRAATHIFARLGAESVFKSFTLTANGALTRNECVVDVLGDNAIAHIAGAAVGDGDFHHDDTVFITHDSLNCESRQVFKKVLRNGATGVFQGKILVKPGAQKTDGYQKSQALLLDGDSQFLAKPELEIYADDVACSHGSTSGAIDDGALFYLQSRGVPLGLAQDLMVLAFMADALQEIEDEDIAEDIRSHLEAWLVRRRD